MQTSTDLSRPESSGAVVCCANKSSARFNGIICFGGVDWWYHNRGHYDIQMMRELSARVPVLYINSIGMRTPRASEGKVFFKRVTRKLKSLKQGRVRVRENFTVFSPATLPGGGRGKIAATIARKALLHQVRRAAKKAGITRPLVWVACPPGATILDDLSPVQVVYQRTDRFENFHGVDPDRIRGFDQQLKAKADLVLFCSRELYNAERDQCSDAAFIDHGVDYDRFEEAGRNTPSPESDPADVRAVPHPRIGFIGGIDAHTFDPPLFVEVARSLPEAHFVLVGGCSLPDAWCDLPNVHHLGRKPYDEVADYMAACDVLIMPWNQSEWIRACNPVKMKEYLAVGRPVVSTWFPEVEHYTDHIAVARGPVEFTTLLRDAIRNPHDPQPGRTRVADHTWTAKADQVWNRLQNMDRADDSVSTPKCCQPSTQRTGAQS
ncbi:MAG: glycosyltransferase [Phycisphaerales bacterium JB065]